ncbi:unnamed protein product, partial [Rotaria magnacalcarata]
NSSSGIHASSSLRSQKHSDKLSTTKTLKRQRDSSSSADDDDDEEEDNHLLIQSRSKKDSAPIVPDHNPRKQSE